MVSLGREGGWAARPARGFLGIVSVATHAGPVTVPTSAPMKTNLATAWLCLVGESDDASAKACEAEFAK